MTSGRAQMPADIDALCHALRAMRRESEIELCGSLGLVSEADLAKLKKAGYHVTPTSPAHGRLQ